MSSPSGDGAPASAEPEQTVDVKAMPRVLRRIAAEAVRQAPGRVALAMGASLGANCTVVCGNTIGRYAFVGAGSVVTSDVPDYALIYGNPARVRGWVCACGIKLDFTGGERATCPACGQCYIKQAQTVNPISPEANH